MNRINCSKGTVQRKPDFYNSTSSNTSIEKEPYKTVEDNDIHQIIDLQQFENKEYLNRLLHPIMRTNRIRCTDITKYQQLSKKKAQFHQTNNIPIVEKNAKEESVPDDETKLKDAPGKIEDCAGIDHGIHNNVKEDIDDNAENSIKKEDKKEVQKVNISINASPLILDLLQSMKISDYISIKPADGLEKPIDYPDAEEADSSDS
ncbi:MAG: hypothetical protein GX066_10040 [Clostridiaceae bacterium]|nr:hypothetical protein [Clostridiaceae bacterium]